MSTPLQLFKFFVEDAPPAVLKELNPEDVNLFSKALDLGGAPVRLTSLSHLAC